MASGSESPPAAIGGAEQVRTRRASSCAPSAAYLRRPVGRAEPERLCRDLVSRLLSRMVVLLQSIQMLVFIHVFKTIHNGGIWL